ncbi:MAG: DUF6029 family protein [Bacteroidia bacterium]
MIKHKLKNCIIASLIILFSSITYNTNAQLNLPNGVSGSFQMDAQSYKEDSIIGAPDVPENIGTNGYLDLKFNSGNFKAGLRYEAYLNALQGYDPEGRYKGTGITNRYAGYTYENLEITAGNFYDQFGSGLIFRSYYDYDLGYDNAMDGMLLKYNTNGIYAKGFIARQRAFFDYGPGLVRGIDGEIHLSELFPSAKWGKTNLILGGSFVSKFQQKDQSSTIKQPENVGASAGRLNFIHGPFNIYAEYAYKINDPSYVNNYIFAPGQSLYITTSYTKKGFGINAAAKRIDNMNFRSDRDATGNVLNINYLPAISKNQTYRLATLYPYATQPNGEMGIMGEVFYTFKPDTKLGGKHGTSISVNASHINDIDREPTGDEYGYHSDFFKVGETVFYQDVNVEITKKLSKKIKAIATYINQIYNEEVLKGHPDSPMIYTNIAVLDLTYKFTTTKSLRMEFQHLWTEQDLGNWAFILAEYTIAPHWSFNAYDEYNYGNDNKDLRVHYLNGGIVYNKGVTRLALGYGKQRSGLLCVGGVCRQVPASNGFTFSVSTSF